MGDSFAIVAVVVVVVLIVFVLGIIYVMKRRHLACFKRRWRLAQQDKKQVMADTTTTVGSRGPGAPPVKQVPYAMGMVDKVVELHNTDLAFMDATSLLRLLREGSISSTALLELFMERVRRLNPAINAVVATCFDQALIRAAELDAAFASGEPLGALHGLPMTVKEEVHVAGMATTHGDPQHDGHAEEADSEAVCRLRAAGAVIFGKTNVPLRCLDWQAYNKLFGATANPWDASVSPGGSSGGSAAALAAGLTPLELGGDSAGSIRVPASFCGVVGLCPTLARVPTGKEGHGSSFVVYGPIARTVPDAALAFQVLSGTAPSGQVSDTAAASLRVAVWADERNHTPSADIRQALSDVVTHMRRVDMTVDETARPAGVSARESLALYMDMIAGGQDTQSRQRVCEAWDSFFVQGFDALVMPVTVSAAFQNDHAHGQNALTEGRSVLIDGQRRAYSEHYFWPHFAIYAKLPSVAVPTGFTAAGLPVGVQVVGKSGCDERVMQVARQVMDATAEARQDANEFAERVPPGFV